MIFFRITTKPYIHDLSGTGAMRYGGRWNPKGRRMLYTSESLSLAMLEVMANSSSNQIGKGFYCTELELPDQYNVGELTVLPKGWNSYPFSNLTIDAGRQFLDGGGLCLKVPSSIVSSESNFLLNPLHDHFHHLKINEVKPLLFDQRLWN
ncbi:RES domain-containing protein [Reichenbachiella faecimaris]|uniref:RES domain-containing protein n=1 Tax=Reichenbachiella faecimaris TaxID=692418 RepID=A0A1W2GQG5_REIFA|nr:RES family NAD+ phosphorylase [Reichenbachiella faecimaris]SMD38851.1 RES domain-containing protein [Reichenbachiella faecimaris]